MTEKLKEIQDGLAEKLNNLFNHVMDEREEFYSNNNDYFPYARDEDSIISSIISNYANKNAFIAASLNLVPGPYGLFVLAPEIFIVLTNQIKMICDIAFFLGQKKRFDRKIILSLIMCTFGFGTTGFMLMQTGEFALKNISVEFLQNMLLRMAGRVSTQFLEGFLSKWLPFAGCVIMSIIARQTTISIGHRAKEIYIKNLKAEENSEHQKEPSLFDEPIYYEEPPFVEDPY